MYEVHCAYCVCPNLPSRCHSLQANLLSHGTCFFLVIYTVRPVSNVHSLYPPFAHYLRIILRSVRAYGSFGLQLPYGRCWKSNCSRASQCKSQTPLLFVLLLFLFFLFMDCCFTFTCCTLLSVTISLIWDVSLIITYITFMPYCFPAHLRHCHPKCDLWGMLLIFS